MTFEESIKIIKDNMREGDVKLVADAIGCTKPVVFNALQKTSLAEMTITERKAFNYLIDFIPSRNKMESETASKAIKLAEELVSQL